MIGGSRVVVGLDVGCTKTSAVVLEDLPEDRRRHRVLGVGLARTEGMRSAEVTDLEATTRSIRESVEEAEVMAGREIQSVYVGLAGGHVELGTSAGVVAISGPEVRRSDVERVHEVGRAVVLPPDREMIHAIPQEYRVDGRGGIDDPVGMEATRLETDVCVVAGASAACRDLRKAVDRAGYLVDELVLEPLATSLAVLRDSEREGGVALVEMGGAATNVAVFRQERLVRLHSLSWGGRTVTSDIVKGLGVPREEAERLKRQHGAALTEMVDPQERLEVPGPSPGSARKVSRELLAHIMEQRMDEIYGLVYDRLVGEGALDDLASGVVLSGGGACVPGAVELAQRVFNTPVRLGEPGGGLAGYVDAVARPTFATAVGLALYGSMRERSHGGMAAERVLHHVTEWLREFF